MSTAKPVRTSRRSFFWKLGAGVSTAAATTAVMGRAAIPPDDLSQRVALLEEEKKLRGLHEAFQLAMDQGLHEEAIGMFADDAEILFNGHVFDQRSRGISRLLGTIFPAGKTGRRMEPAPGFEPAAGSLQVSVELAEDRRSATAAFPYSIQVGMPIECDSSLASMARLHGEGVQTWWEGGVYNVTYVKDAAKGCWMIRRLEYNTLSRADYRPGRSYATAMAQSPIPAHQLA